MVIAIFYNSDSFSHNCRITSDNSDYFSPHNSEFTFAVQTFSHNSDLFLKMSEFWDINSELWDQKLDIFFYSVAETSFHSHQPQTFMCFRKAQFCLSGLAAIKNMFFDPRWKDKSQNHNCFSCEKALSNLKISIWNIYHQMIFLFVSISIFPIRNNIGSLLSLCPMIRESVRTVFDVWCNRIQRWLPFSRPDFLPSDPWTYQIWPSPLSHHLHSVLTAALQIFVTHTGEIATQTFWSALVRF